MESKDIVTIVVAIISSGAFSAIVNALIAVWREKKERDTGVAAGVRIILYDRIKWLGNKYIERGSIRTDELEDLIAMHQIYHNDLDGNGFLDSIMTTVKMLPIKK